MSKCVFVSVVAATLCAGATRAQVLPGARVFTNAWRNAGCQGAIPSLDTIVNVRDFGAVGDGITNDYPAVAAAIAALGGSPGVVYVPAGTYLMQSAVRLPAGTVLRGQRPHNTTLRFDIVPNCILVSKGQSTTFQSIVSGHTLHSRVIGVSDGSVFAPGDYAEIREENDPAWGASPWAIYVAGQIVRIVGVVGNTLTLETALRLNYQASLNPEIRLVSPIADVGIENLKIERLLAGSATDRNNSYTILLNYAANCWLRGLHLYNAFGAHVSMVGSTRNEVTGCYFQEAHEFDGGGSGYGVKIQSKTGECLIENNIFRHLRHSMLVQVGANGNVFGYNYSREQERTEFPADASSDITCHGNYPFANLYEGNICQYIAIDNSHGVNGPLNTFFRNRVEDYGVNMSDPFADNQNIVGNETFKGKWAIFIGDGYKLTGSGHFEYGNNTEADGMQPTGTGDLSDYSYYLGPNPTQSPPVSDFWNIADMIPIIGPPHTRCPTKTNPAYARYFAGGSMTVAPPSIAAQPTNLVVDMGQFVLFTVEAYGSPKAEFAWQKQGVPIAGETNASFAISGCSPTDSGTYAVVVSDNYGAVKSATAALAVNAVCVDLPVQGCPAECASPHPSATERQN